MKIKAFLQMKDDFERLDFTLFHFTKHNPDIPILVVNDGGSDPSFITEKYQSVDLINEKKCCWVKNSGNGTFGYTWFERLFHYAFADDCTHVLFLETDVYCKKKIEIVPSFDISGFMNSSGISVNKVCYAYFNLKDYGFEFNKFGGEISFLHTGCGGTIYSKEFFEKSLPNLHLIKNAYLQIPDYCFQDVLITILGIISGCSIGNWEELTQMHYPNYNTRAALVHNYKCDIVLKGNR